LYEEIDEVMDTAVGALCARLQQVVKLLVVSEEFPD
jgi:hypothetical protein